MFEFWKIDKKVDDMMFNCLVHGLVYGVHGGVNVECPQCKTINERTGHVPCIVKGTENDEYCG